MERTKQRTDRMVKSKESKNGAKEKKEFAMQSQRNIDLTKDKEKYHSSVIPGCRCVTSKKVNRHNLLDVPEVSLPCSCYFCGPSL